MSHAGLKQQLIAVPSDVEPARKSGRYELDERRAEEARQIRAEREDATQKIALLMQVNTLSDEELGWIKARSSRPPVSASMRPNSGAVFAKEGEDPTFGALQPFYREPTLERVQLQFEDLSLDPSHNPLALSSLLPPSKQHPVITRSWAIAVGALALASVGYLAVAAGWSAPSSPTTVVSPARKALAPRVVVAPSADDSLQVDAPRDTLAPDPQPAPSEEVPWSIVGRAEVAPSALPSAPSRVAAALEPAPRAPGWNRRRILALRAARAAASTARPGTQELPDEPNREQILTGIDSVHAAVQTCAGAAHGTSIAKITIAGTGRVASATISGAFAGTTQGSCIARALRGAEFPRFKTATLQVTYPFRL